MAYSRHEVGLVRHEHREVYVLKSLRLNLILLSRHALWSRMQLLALSLGILAEGEAASKCELCVWDQGTQRPASWLFQLSEVPLDLWIIGVICNIVFFNIELVLFR